ncbi:family 43 glycosylhydrolase [Actinoplanes derwentensis]|uniref:Glycosyl hydrolases family 43 n=1 Tax=Actinoplanes derwentensis TaxID=113562 RepID=A0A1H1XC15_9ACTN|nr:family 43 glycosylhydrolase [Actinoplanes derwentensis]GID89618.1 hypothetical protein Ade03nite_85420 [Actinoplanes derwentensis]SDT06159.1 Glycosyl hydrolases family 43 [Actinoplanes derwentensis]
MSTLAPPGKIAPGSLFTDQDGRIAQLHGAGIQHLDGRFWAWGEDKSAGSTFGGVACYSSPDLATWTSHGHALAPDPATPDLAPGRIVERPKVLPRADGTFVMLLHLDSPDYRDARVGWAIADRPEGPYRYLHGERPLGNESRDIGVFTDTDGASYLLSEDRPHGLHIYRLSPDLLHAEAIVATTLTPAGTHGYESPALVEHDGLYYLFGSDLTGWSTNDNKYATATGPAGPWSDWADFAPPASATHDSQTSVVVTVHGSLRTSHVYIGDRWIKDDLFHSAPVWLPLDIGGGKARLRYRDEWTIDPATGVIA